MNEKKIAINSGLTLIFNETLGELSGFSGGMLNTGDLIASTKSYQKLIEKDFIINAGDTTILDIKGEVLLFNNSQQFLLAKEEEIKGKYLIVKEGLVLPPTYSLKTLFSIEGMYVVGTFYYPSNLAVSSIPGLRAEKMKEYPEESVFIKEKVFSLSKDKLESLYQEKTCFITGTLQMIDDSLKEAANENHIQWIAEKMIIKEEYLQIFKNIQANEKIVVPKDHAYIKDLVLSSTTYPLYGSKLYIENNLLLQPKGVKELEKFDSIIVDKTASITLTGLERFKKIGKANNITPFQGNLHKVNGALTYSSQSLKSLKETGKEVTLMVNGSLQFEEDVQIEDLESIAAIYCNGKISAPESIIAILQEKVEELNGVIGPLHGNDPLEKLLGGEEDENHTAINTGELIIV